VTDSVGPPCLRALLLALLCASLSLSGCSSGDDTGDPDAAPPTTPGSSLLVAPRQTEFETDLGLVTLACEGRGPVPIILLAGAGDGVERWDDLVDAMGQQALACRFDAQAADEVEGTVTPALRSDSLAQALEASGLPSPYLLVGHSLGGLTVRRFGADHGAALGAAILLDPTPAAALLSLHDDLTAAGWDAEATQADLEAEVDWPTVPLTVLSHDPALQDLGDPVIEELWTAGQQQYGALTSDATIEVVAGSGHYIDRDDPGRVLRALDRYSQELSP